MTPSCETCLFARAVDMATPRLECRFSPPVLVGESWRGQWPAVVPHEWCAQYAADDKKCLIQGGVGVLDIQIRDMEFGDENTRIHGALRADGIITIRDLVAKSKAEIDRIPQIGRRSLMSIIAKLDGMGLHLGQIV